LLSEKISGMFIGQTVRLDIFGRADLVVAGNSESADWYVARIKSCQTARALDALERFRVKFNYPVFRDCEIEKPLIPGYVFVQLPFDEDVFAAVNEFDGIDRLLPYHTENPLAVPQKWMDSFLCQLSNAQFDSEVERNAVLPRFGKNEILAVISGPFVGHTGTFVRVRKGVVDLDITFFGRLMTVPFKGHEIQRLM
jgi:transcription antitermination factor NusG